MGRGARHDGGPFIGSTREEAHGVLTLRGCLDDDAPERVDQHLAVLVELGVRHVLVDARDLSRSPAAVLDVLVRAQSDLSRRQGMLTIIGLRGRPFPACAVPTSDRVVATA